MRTITPSLYLPVENAGRELESRLLIAAAAAARGIDVLVGQQWLLNANLAVVPPGIVLFKGMNAVQAQTMFVAVRHAGHAAAVCDEEALGMADPAYMGRGIDPRVGKLCQIFFAQGESHRQAIRIRTGVPDYRVETVGNPRLDLLRRHVAAMHATEAAEIRRRFGRFVLFNTNCGGANSAWGGPDGYRRMCRQLGWMDMDDSDDADLLDRIIANDRANMAAIEATVAAIRGRRPELGVVLRPHPAEDPVYWHRLYPQGCGVDVVTDTAPQPWILASEILLHSGCTTGLEAEILGHPTLCIRAPDRDERVHRHHLANLVNQTADSPEIAAAQVEAVLADGGLALAAGAAARRQRIAEHLAGLDGRPCHARIVDRLERLIRRNGGKEPVIGWKPRLGQELVRSIDRVPYLERKASFTLQDVRARLGGLVDAFDLPMPPVVEPIGDSLFRIHAH